jgi:hypothetical protein
VTNDQRPLVVRGQFRQNEYRAPSKAPGQIIILTIYCSASENCHFQNTISL